MSKHKNKTQQPKPKEFTITDFELSELSFIRQSLRTFEEVVFYWSNRWEQKLEDTLTRVGIKDRKEYHIDLSRLWTEKKIFATHLPQPKVEPKQDEQLHKEPEPGGEARK